ncbi:MAG: type III secretion system inner rod subunit SctI [Parashewanella sp.]
MDFSTLNQIQKLSSEKLKPVKEEPTAQQDLVNKFQELMNVGKDELDKANDSVVHGTDEKLIKQLLPTDPSKTDAMGNSMSPLAVVEAQKHITNAALQVDLMAKVAGSLSQSINKLASMQ